MNFSQALDLTLKDFGITARSIAEKSQVSEQMISRFRLGKQNIYTNNLEKIIQALPEKAQSHFYSLLLEQSVRDRCPSAKELTSKMNPIELAELLNAIAKQLVQQTSEQTEQKVKI